MIKSNLKTILFTAFCIICTAIAYAGSDTITYFNRAIVNETTVNGSFKIQVDPPNLTADRAITWPDLSGEMCLISGTQALTGKTIDADLNTITNIEDADIKAAAAISRSKLSQNEPSSVTFKTQSYVLFEDDAGGQTIGWRSPVGVTSYNQEWPATAPGSSQALICTGGSPGGCVWASVVTNPVVGDFTVDSPTFFVDSANNRVGVGTLTPSVALDVAGSSKVSGDLTVDTSTLYVDSTNNLVGVGTASPVTLFHSKTTSAVQAGRFSYANSSTASTLSTITLVLENTNSTAGNSESIWGGNASGGVAAGIQFYNMTHAAGTGGTGEIGFNVADTTANPPEMMRISSSEVKIKGVTNNSAAASGYVGESKFSASSSGTTLTVSGTLYVGASQTLTAGDWDVSGSCLFAAGTFTTAIMYLNNDCDGSPTAPGTIYPGFNKLSLDPAGAGAIATAGDGEASLTSGVYRVSFTGADQTWCTIATVTHTSAPSAYCNIHARRVR